MECYIEDQINNNLKKNIKSLIEYYSEEILINELINYHNNLVDNATNGVETRHDLDVVLTSIDNILQDFMMPLDFDEWCQISEANKKMLGLC